MWRLHFLIILTYASLCVATVAAAALTVRFTRRQRAIHRRLRTLDGKQVHLALTAVVAVIIGYAAYAAKDILSLRYSLRPIALPPQNATQSTVEAELARTSLERAAAALREFELGSEALKRGNVEDMHEALTRLSRSAELFPTKSAYLNLAKTWHAMSRYPEAIESLDAALRLPITVDNRGIHSKCLSQRGVTYLTIARFTDARVAFLDAQADARQSRDQLAEARALYNLAMVEHYSGNLAQAVSLNRRAQSLFAAQHDVLGEIRALYAIGHGGADRGDRAAAIAAFSRMRDLASSNSDPAAEAFALEGAARLAALDGRRAEARSWLDRAKKLRAAASSKTYSTPAEK
jgi:tetratricopeptide (TPR) repeat protein